MWSIINKTPFAAGQQFVQSSSGELVWQIVAKATFEIDAGQEKLFLAEKQVKVHQKDEYRGEPHNSSLVHASDFALGKFNVDLLLNATAHSPGERPVTELLAGFRLGQLVKVLKIFGNREYDSFLGIIHATSPSQFFQMPILYEKAYGGFQEDDKKGRIYFEKRNPAGTGYFISRKDSLGLWLPNIEYPGYPTKKRAGRNEVAGFGPIPPHWWHRARYAGSHKTEGQPVFPLETKDTFNPLYLQTAPEDQQLKEYSGGEAVILYNLHPRYDEIRFNLPQVNIHCEILMDGETSKHESHLQTIVMEPDILKLQMVWQANIVCRRQGKTLEWAKITHTIKF